MINLSNDYLNNDYMVSIGTDFLFFQSLKQARENAKLLSIKHGKANIQKWVYDDELQETVLDDYFYIEFRNGVEQPSDD